VTVIALPDPPLADGVVVLRPWREADIPELLAAFADPWFERFSDWAPRTEATVRRYLAATERAREHGRQLEFSWSSRATTTRSSAARRSTQWTSDTAVGPSATG
jgi:hypothetical protein